MVCSWVLAGSIVALPNATQVACPNYTTPLKSTFILHTTRKNITEPKTICIHNPNHDLYATFQSN
jgi:hypothetical protein